MTSFLRLVTVLLLFTALGHTQVNQWGEAPSKGAFRQFAGKAQTGRHKHRSFEGKLGQGKAADFITAGEETSGAPSTVGSYRLDLITNISQRTSRATAASRPGDSRFSGLNGIHGVVENAGSMVGWSAPNQNADFVRRTAIPGLPAGATAAKLWSLFGQPMMTVVTPFQVVSYYLDYNNWTVGTPVTFAPPLGPGKQVQLAAPLMDAIYQRFHGWLVVVFDAANNRQEIYFNYSPTGAAPFLFVMYSPPGNRISDIYQFEGGAVVMACESLVPTSQFPDCVLIIDFILAAYAELSSAGGPAYLGMACPWIQSGAQGTAFLAVGLPITPGITIPGINGPLGLIPGQWVLFGPQTPVSGLGGWYPIVGRLAQGSFFFTQGLFLDPRGVAWFSNTTMLQVM